MTEYVFPHYAKQEEEISKIQGISRLFAYPKTPHYKNNGKKVIMDSGAFGLSLQGRKINKNHMIKLDKHYRDNVRENTLCIAPDEYLNPMQSMMNIRKWFANDYYPHVSAVIQANQEKIIDINNLKFQAHYYSSFTDEICFSNNSLTSEMAKMYKLEELFRYMKKELKVKWIHILGAGWDLEDIKGWLDIGYYDSLDSIAYYQPRYVEQFGSLEPIENIKSICKLVYGDDIDV